MVHELSHLKYREHSPAFWSLLKTQLPDYESQKQWLARNESQLCPRKLVEAGEVPAPDTLEELGFFAEHAGADNPAGVLVAVGTGAMDLEEEPDDEEDLTVRGVRGATAANRLVFRQLLIWVVVIAALTLYGWTL